MLGICYGVDTTGTNGVRSGTNGYRYCANSFGVPPSLSDHTHGDTPVQTYLRNERVVAYVPNLRYEGPDFFTYEMYDGLNVQTHITQNGQGTENQVEMHVRDCRPVDYNDQFNISSVVHPLCTCDSTDTSLIGNMVQCATARANVCGNSTSQGSSSVIAGNVHFYTMCEACSTVVTGTGTGTGTDPLGSLRGECLWQIMRAVSMLKTVGLCSSKPYYDCTAESITVPGLDKVNYLSLKSTPAAGAFSELGNSFGGVGWFGSAATGKP